MSWRQFILAMGLHTPEEFDTYGFRAYWDESSMVIASKGDIRGYWDEISFSDVLKGGSEGAQMSGGDFIARFVDHFGMHTKERLQGTTVVVGELIEIDLDELSRLHICEMLVERLGSARTREAAGLCHKGWRGLRRSIN
uniref:Uncharacterized protein n=1 Tax=Tanacetum cinerariifolium TaxID=118510 RepID=A0A699KIE5_TANCI|nr:hypothetical protein [Tanacetum cinerariifolium]